MRRDEAGDHIGKLVEVWTASNGIYTGVLRTVIAEPGQPWRGLVKIDGVLEVAIHFDGSGPCRKGYRAGETIEAGGCNIHAARSTGTASYEDALMDTIERMRREIERMKPGRAREELLMAGRAYRCALNAERERLGGRGWRIAGRRTLC